MRGTACLLLPSFLLLPAPAAAGQVADPIFWASPADFLRQVEGGELVARLELHLLQYASDPRWRSAWDATRYGENGLLAEYGSTTSNELYSSSRIALNVFPAPWLQLRFDRRQQEDNRFQVSDQRLEALFYPGAGWALVLAGWPTFEKEDASLGLGLRLGGPRGGSALDLRLLEERYYWNEKSESGLRLSRPLRLLADGFAEVGRCRLHGSIDWGLGYRAEEAGGRQARGSLRHGEAELECDRGEWGAGLRLTGASLARSQSEVGGAAARLDRSWGRVVVSLRRGLGRWTASAQAGVAAQRDDFSSPDATGSYWLDTALVGLDGGWRATGDLTVALGYLASLQRGRRGLEAPGALPAAEANDYYDKAHLRAVYDFGPRMSIELLLSQALRGGRFGGGSVKVMMVP